MGCRATRKSRRWNIVQLKCRATRLSRRWDIAQLKCRASEKSRKWDVAQLKCRADEISRKKCRANDVNLISDGKLARLNVMECSLCPGKGKPVDPHYAR